ncbi:hypothetical protein ACIP98_33655 [Streptomyces sp. NPDC088354]|uniref:hypothetical protein n=1 Tax=Streptomyces sp. NPDC088354 TaxID=3365856 RepID=UPI00380B4F58
MYSGSAFGFVRTWDVRDGTPPLLRGGSPTLRVVFALAVGRPMVWGGMVTGVGFAPRDGLLASGDAVGRIRLRDTTGPGRPAAYGLPVTGHAGSVRSWRSARRKVC